MHKDLVFYINAIHCATNYLPTTLEQLIAEYCILLEWERLVRDLKLGGENFSGVYKPNIDIRFGHSQQIIEPKLTQIYIQPIKYEIEIHKGYMCEIDILQNDDPPCIFWHCIPHYTDKVWTGDRSLHWKYNIICTGPDIEIFLNSNLIKYGVANDVDLANPENSKILCAEFISPDYVIKCKSTLKYVCNIYCYIMYGTTFLRKINANEWKTVDIFKYPISILCNELQTYKN